MQSVVRQSGNIAHAGEYMFRAIGKALNFLRVGDAAKQSKAHTHFGGVGLKFITKQQAMVVDFKRNQSSGRAGISPTPESICFGR